MGKNPYRSFWIFNRPPSQDQCAKIPSDSRLCRESIWCPSRQLGMPLVSTWRPCCFAKKYLSSICQALLDNFLLNRFCISPFQFPMPMGKGGDEAEWACPDPGTYQYSPATILGDGPAGNEAFLSAALSLPGEFSVRISSLGKIGRAHV